MNKTLTIAIATIGTLSMLLGSSAMAGHGHRHGGGHHHGGGGGHWQPHHWHNGGGYWRHHRWFHPGLAFGLAAAAITTNAVINANRAPRVIYERGPCSQTKIVSHRYYPNGTPYRVVRYVNNC